MRGTRSKRAGGTLAQQLQGVKRCQVCVTSDEAWRRRHRRTQRGRGRQAGRLIGCPFPLPSACGQDLCRPDLPEKRGRAECMGSSESRTPNSRAARRPSSPAAPFLQTRTPSSRSPVVCRTDHHHRRRRHRDCLLTKAHCGGGGVGGGVVARCPFDGRGLPVCHRVRKRRRNVLVKFWVWAMRPIYQPHPVPRVPPPRAAPASGWISLCHTHCEVWKLAMASRNECHQRCLK